MRFLKLQVLFLVVAVVVVGALIADVVLKNRAETALAEVVTTRVAQTTGVRAKITSFPFVGRIIASGHVPKVVVTAQNSEVGDIALSDVRVQVEDVEMDRDAAMDGRVVVKSIGRGTVQADLRQDQINRLLPRGYSVQLEQDKAAVSGPGASLGQVKTTAEGTIQLSVLNRVLLDLARR